MSRARLWTALELCGYLAACLLVTCSAWGRAVGDGQDLWGTLWFHEWIAHCLRTGTDPGWTPWFYHPRGLDLFAIMGNNYLDFLLAMPARALLPSPDHMAPTTVLLLLGNALAMRALLRSLGLSRVATAAGALCFALHPFFLFEINNGRTAQALMWFWPLALRELLLMDRHRQWWRPVAAGLLVALQAWAYWFTGYFFVLALAPALVVHGLRLDRGWWLRVALAAGVSVVAVAPGIWPMVHRSLSGEVPGLAGNMAGFDILHLRSTLHGWWPLAWGASSFALPVTTGVLTLAALALCRRRLWLIPAALGLLLAAGPTLDLLAGEVVNPLWWITERGAPGFVRLLYPYRAWCVLALVASVALAEALDRWLPNARHRAAALPLVVLLGTASPGPGLPRVRGTDIARPVFVDAVRQAPGVVLNLPFPCTQDHIHYQPMHGQPLMGGMGVGVEALRPRGTMDHLTRDPQTDALLTAGQGLPLKPGAVPPTKGKRAYRWVVLHKDIYRRAGVVQGCWQGKTTEDRAATARALVVRLLGRPTVEDRHAAAWDLKADR